MKYALRLLHTKLEAILERQALITWRDGYQISSRINSIPSILKTN